MCSPWHLLTLKEYVLAHITQCKRAEEIVGGRGEIGKCLLRTYCPGVQIWVVSHIPIIYMMGKHNSLSKRITESIGIQQPQAYENPQSDLFLFKKLCIS